MVCSHCGKANPDGKKVCGSCGKEIPTGFGITKILPRISFKWKTRGEREAPTSPVRVLYLHSDVGPPLKLTPIKVLTIGRHPQNDLVLDSDGVSRRHARIEYREPYFFLLDLDSANGTRVSGELIAEYPLMPGTEIQIHDFRLHVKADTDEGPEPLESAGEETLRIDAETLRKGQHTNLKGSLAETTLVEICRLLKTGAKTGTLYLPDGRVHILEGRITHAEADDRTGVDAFFHLVQSRQGIFEFRAGMPALHHSIEMSTSALLVDAAARFQEG